MHRRHRSLQLLLALVLPFIGQPAAGTEIQQRTRITPATTSDNTVEVKAAQRTADPVLDDSLLRVADEASLEGATSRLLPVHRGEVATRVFVIPEQSGEVLKRLLAAGVTISGISRSGDVIYAHVPPEQLKPVSRIPGVARVRRPAITALDVLTEAAGPMNVGSWHSAGLLTSA